MPNATPLEELIASELQFLDSATAQGGNRSVICVHCKCQFRGSHTRQVAHLLGVKSKGIAVLPELHCIATRVTACVASSGGCERYWSTYDFIHSRKRNRLTPKRANDLVYVFANMRLTEKFSEPAKFSQWVSEIASEDDEDLEAAMEELDCEGALEGGEGEGAGMDESDDEES